MFGYPTATPFPGPGPAPFPAPAMVPAPNAYCTIHVHAFGGPTEGPLVVQTTRDIAAQFEGLAPAARRGDPVVHLHVQTQQGTGRLKA